MIDEDYNLKEAFLKLRDLNKKKKKQKKLVNFPKKQTENIKFCIKFGIKMCKKMIELDAKFFYVTGIFRVPANEADFVEFKEHMQKSEMIDLEQSINPFLLSSGLKYIIRDVIDGLIDGYVLEQIYGFDDVSNIDADELLAAIIALIEPSKSKLFINVLDILAQTSYYSLKNRMGVKSLSIVFTPVFIGKSYLVNFDVNAILEFSNVFSVLIEARLRKFAKTMVFN